MTLQAYLLFDDKAYVGQYHPLILSKYFCSNWNIGLVFIISHMDVIG